MQRDDFYWCRFSVIADRTVSASRLVSILKCIGLNRPPANLKLLSIDCYHNEGTTNAAVVRIWGCSCTAPIQPALKPVCMQEVAGAKPICGIPSQLLIFQVLDEAEDGELLQYQLVRQKMVSYW